MTARHCVVPSIMAVDDDMQEKEGEVEAEAEAEAEERNTCID